MPPCGPVDPLDPDSDVRCEIVPEMFTGESLRVVGSVWNRTMVPWPHDPMALQVDVDGNGVFAGSTETGFARVPSMIDVLHSSITTGPGIPNTLQVFSE